METKETGSERAREENERREMKVRNMRTWRRKVRRQGEENRADEW